MSNLSLRWKMMSGAGPGGPKRRTITVYPSSLDDSISVYESYTDLNNAFDSGAANNYAKFYWVKGSNAETYVYLNFDLSAIPAGATIIDVSGQSRINMTGYQSTRWQVRECFLSAGTTQKSNGNYNNSLFTFSSPGTWTVDELHNAKLCYHVQRRNQSGNYNEPYYLYVYGGSITVTYEI